MVYDGLITAIPPLLVSQPKVPAIRLSYRGSRLWPFHSIPFSKETLLAVVQARLKS